MVTSFNLVYGLRDKLKDTSCYSNTLVTSFPICNGMKCAYVSTVIDLVKFAAKNVSCLLSHLQLQ